MSSEEQINLFAADTLAAKASPAGFDPAAIPTSASVPIPTGTYQSLEQLIPHCHSCQRCGLAAGRTHVVISRGNPQAALMVIGEGPGQQEDETGLPFVGRAGQLLDKILASVDLNSEQDVYIANIVKCRPPGNRVPTPDESAAANPISSNRFALLTPRLFF